METLAVVIEAPGALALRRLGLAPLGDADVLVETEWSGVSTGTEKLLWTGRMPDFPGMGYPLVPGYETVGRVVEAGAAARALLGARVFVPGASCYEGARGLFGGAARRIVVPAARVVPVSDMGAEAVLLALAATAHHAIAGGRLPDLIVGHGVLGRLAARIALALGGAPAVWEVDPARMDGARGYAVQHPDADNTTDRCVILDLSGDSDLIDTLIGRLAKGGELVLGGFYRERLSFAFTPAFRREARIRLAAEFASTDIAAVRALLAAGSLSLDGLLTDIEDVRSAERAYPRAFEDSACLKMVLDWRALA